VHEANGASPEHPIVVPHSLSTAFDSFNFDFQTTQSGHSEANLTSKPWETADNHISGYHALERANTPSLAGVQAVMTHGIQPEALHSVTVEGTHLDVRAVVHDHHFIL
jgi:hypothetical protein